jgi:hypothetical protein
MAGKTFRLDSLAPDRPGIEFEGRRYEAQLPQDFGLVVEAQRLKLIRDYGEITEEFTKNPESIENAQKIHDVLGDIIHIYFPKLPDDVLERIATPVRIQVITWWREECFPQALSRMAETSWQMGPQPAQG